MSSFFRGCSTNEQIFLINFTLINEWCLAIKVVCDAKRHMITTEPMVLEICFDIQVLWMTSMFPERLMLANQGFSVYLLGWPGISNIRSMSLLSLFWGVTNHTQMRKDGELNGWMSCVFVSSTAHHSGLSPSPQTSLFPKTQQCWNEASC